MHRHDVGADGFFDLAFVTASLHTVHLENESGRTTSLQENCGPESYKFDITSTLLL